MMPKNMVEVRDLEKRFGEIEAVRGVSFSVFEEEIFSLLGPNGAGKTTTINMLCTLLEPTAGTAAIAGYDISQQADQVRETIGIVPQEIALYEDLSARQNLYFWGQMYGLGGKTLRDRAAGLLAQVNLTDRADNPISTYSGGMKRRINIAVGLLHKPRLLFMDEPTVGIDPQSRRRILEMVKELREQGMTIIYTTHYMEEAEELSDRVAIIDHGQLIALGKQEELTRIVGSQETLRLQLDPGTSFSGDTEVFMDIPGVLQVTGLDGEIALSVTEVDEVLAQVVHQANVAQLPIRAIHIEEPNLEAVFLQLTGRALRD